MATSEPKQLRQIAASKMTIATIKHARKAGLCSRGMRAFAESRGYSWDDFLDNGVTTEFLRSLDDAIATRVAEIAEEEENGQR